MDNAFKSAVARLDRALSGQNFNNVVANLGLSDQVAQTGT